MARAYASTVIEAPAETVWSRIRDFNSMAVWNAGRVVRSEIEDDKRGDQVGAIRSFVLANGVQLREILVAHSDRDRSYSYGFLKCPFEVDSYFASLRVSPVTNGNRSFVEWLATFDCERSQRPHYEGFFSSVVFQNGLDALARCCNVTL